MKKLILLLTLSLLLTACNININLGNQDPSTKADPQSTATPAATTSPTFNPMASPTNTSDIEDQISQYFQNKFNKTPAEVNLEIQQNTGTHASGGVSFTGEMGGGMWFAHSDGSTWTVDFDGNGTPMCTDIQPHNYPASIITECWDESTSQLIQL